MTSFISAFPKTMDLLPTAGLRVFLGLSFLVCFLVWLGLHLNWFPRDPLNFVLIDSYPDRIGGWSIMHLFMYIIAGVFWPSKWFILVIIGVVWECVEFGIGLSANKTRCPDKVESPDALAQQYDPESWAIGNMYDIVMNVSGLAIGVAVNVQAVRYLSR